MIMTTPSNWMTKARAVLNTWAKRCHIPLFFYSRSAAKRGDPIINATHTVALDVPEGRGHLTGKTMAALRYSLATYCHVVDWFLKCDDDTSVLLAQIFDRVPFPNFQRYRSRCIVPLVYCQYVLSPCRK